MKDFLQNVKWHQLGDNSFYESSAVQIFLFFYLQSLLQFRSMFSFKPIGNCCHLVGQEICWWTLKRKLLSIFTVERWGGWLSDIHHPDIHHLRHSSPIVAESDIHHPGHSSPQTFITSDIHHLRHSSPPYWIQTFITSDIHHPLPKIRHSSPQTFITSDVHHLRHSSPKDID